MSVSKGVNKVFLLGNLGQDPELKYFDSGKCICNMNICTTEYYTGADGVKKEDVQWHKVVCWDKSAEVVQKLFKKGDAIFIEGKSKTRTYENKENKKVKITEVVISEFTKI